MEPPVEEGAADLRVETRPPGRSPRSVPTRGTVHMLLGHVARVVLGVAVPVLLTRGLGDVRYGVYAVLLSVLTWTELACNAGTQSATTRRIQDDRAGADVVEATAKLLHLAVGCAAFVLLWLLAPAVAGWLRIEDGAFLFRVAILDLPVAGLYFAYQGIFAGQRRFGTLAPAFAVYAGAKALLVVGLFAVGFSVEAALVVNVLATVAALVWLVPRAALLPARPSTAVAWTLVRLSLPMGTYLVVSQLLLSTDLWLLKGLWSGDAEVVGHYAAASNLARTLGVVPAALSGVLLASLSGALARREEELARHHVRSAGRFTLIVLAPACALGALHAEELMVFLFGQAFAPGGTYFALLVVVFGLVGVMDAHAHALMAAGLERGAALLVAPVVPLALALELWWIPRFGGVGAAAAALVALAAAAIAAGAVVARRFGAPLPARTLVRVAVATGVVCAVGLAVPSTGLLLPVELAALLLLYGGLLFLLRELDRDDLRSVLPW